MPSPMPERVFESLTPPPPTNLNSQWAESDLWSSMIWSVGLGPIPTYHMWHTLAPVPHVAQGVSLGYMLHAVPTEDQPWALALG